GGGTGQGWPGGGKGIQPGGHADGLQRAAGALPQRRLGRTKAQPPVHDSESLALFAVRECARREERLSRRNVTVCTLSLLGQAQSRVVERAFALRLLSLSQP